MPTRRFVVLLTAALTLMFAAAPVMAQEQQGTIMRVWSMFFYNVRWDFIGLTIVWTLLLLSMLCMGFGLNLVMRFRRQMVLPDETYAQVRQMLQARQHRQAIDYTAADESYLGRLLNAALTEASNGYAAMERALEEAGDLETTRYLRPVEYLSVVGNIAPMMGLFGTVYGMIVAFQQLVEIGGRPDPVELAGGISTALVTTFWGLVVAIPSMTAYALLRNKIDALTSEGLLMAEQIIAPFKPAAKAGPPPTTPGSSAPDRPRLTPRPQ